MRSTNVLGALLGVGVVLLVAGPRAQAAETCFDAFTHEDGRPVFIWNKTLASYIESAARGTKVIPAVNGTLREGAITFDVSNDAQKLVMSTHGEEIELGLFLTIGDEKTSRTLRYFAYVDVPKGRPLMYVDVHQKKSGGWTNESAEVVAYLSTDEAARETQRAPGYTIADAVAAKSIADRLHLPLLLTPTMFLDDRADGLFNAGLRTPDDARRGIMAVLKDGKLMLGIVGPKDLTIESFNPERFELAFEAEFTTPTGKIRRYSIPVIANGVRGRIVAFVREDGVEIRFIERG